MRQKLKNLWWTICCYSVEISIVLIVLGFIMVLIATIPQAMKEHERREASLERLERIESHLCAASPNKVFLKCE